MDYRELPKYEKYQALKKYYQRELKFRRCPFDRHDIAIYLKAIWLNDKETINSFEKFGSDPDYIFSNRRSYQKRLLFGFSEISIEKSGRLTKCEFLDVERFEFPHKEGWAILNYITIGKGPNDKYSYGISCNSNTEGYGRGLSEFGGVFSNRKECLAEALTELKNWIEKRKKDTESTQVLKQVNSLYDEITNRKPLQLTLF